MKTHAPLQTRIGIATGLQMLSDGRYYKEKVAETPALYDGAVILSRASIAESYAVARIRSNTASPLSS